MEQVPVRLRYQVLNQGTVVSERINIMGEFNIHVHEVDEKEGLPTALTVSVDNEGGTQILEVPQHVAEGIEAGNDYTVTINPKAAPAVPNQEASASGAGSTSGAEEEAQQS